MYRVTNCQTFDLVLVSKPLLDVPLNLKTQCFHGRATKASSAMRGRDVSLLKKKNAKKPSMRLIGDAAMTSKSPYQHTSVVDDGAKIKGAIGGKNAQQDADPRGLTLKGVGEQETAK